MAGGERSRGSWSQAERDAGRDPGASGNGGSRANRVLSARADTERAFLALCIATPQYGEPALAEVDLDGVFTYICVSEDALGMAKDELAAKPMVLYEGDDMVALASEEMAIRAVIDHEIETYDPYEGEVMVWTR